MSTKTVVKNEIVAAGKSASEILAAHGFRVERVKPEELQGGDTKTEAEIVELMLRDGYANPEAAFAALFSTFGIGRYADKNALASEGTPFKVRRIVERIDGGFTKEDDWALEIVTEDGEPQILTMEKNPGRDKFNTALAFAISKFGETPWVCLHRFDKSNETHFFSLGPVGAKTEMRNVTAARVSEAETIEGEFKKL